MRTMRMLLFLLLCVPVFGQDVPKYEERFDKFKYESVFKLPLEVERDRFYGSRMRLIITVIYPIKGKPSHYFHFMPERPTLYEKPTLRMLIDGLLMEIPSDQIDETAIFKLRPEQFDFISRSKKVEIQLSTFEGSLPPESIAGIKSLQDAITKLPADRRPPR